jgi:hypothetical protein
MFRICTTWICIALGALTVATAAEPAGAASRAELPPRAGQPDLSSLVEKRLARSRAGRRPSRNVLRQLRRDSRMPARIASTLSEPNVAFVCNGVYNLAHFTLYSNATFGARYGEPVLVRQGFRYWTAAGTDKTTMYRDFWHYGSTSPRVVTWQPQIYLPRLVWVRLVLQTWSQRTGWLTWSVRPTLDAPSYFGYNAQVSGDWCQAL